MNNLFFQFQQFARNPAALMNRLNLPQEVQGNPQQAIQYLMDSGRLSQGQYNQLRQMATQMQNNPAFFRMFQ